MNFSTTNNFDLIRLFAASQVAIIHSAYHLDYENTLLSALNIFPGVPIFFFISGYLIYTSYRNSHLSDRPNRKFFFKRVLRLYPALLFCFAFSVFLLIISGYLLSAKPEPFEFAIWAFTGLSIFQFFNPEFLRGFGVGSINGSLWTISTELQFYLLTPLIFFILKKKIAVTIFLISFFLVLNILNAQINNHVSILGKLFSVSFAPWIYMFLIGATIASRPQFLTFVMKLNTPAILIAYLTIWWVSNKLELGWGNSINPIAYCLLIVLVLKAAYAKPKLSNVILNKNDISYGIYIFHMPIVNFLIYKNITGLSAVILAITLTTIVAIGSWFLIEKPALKLKRK